jgi:hypothetical protein
MLGVPNETDERCNDFGGHSQKSEEFLDSINEVMKSARKNLKTLSLEYRDEDDDQVYFLETRKDFYPLQLFDFLRRDKNPG